MGSTHSSSFRAQCEGKASAPSQQSQSSNPSNNDPRNSAHYEPPPQMQRPLSFEEKLYAKVSKKSVFSEPWCLSFGCSACGDGVSFLTIDFFFATSFALCSSQNNLWYRSDVS